MNEVSNIDKLRSKDTRWDRIRKRHLNSLNVKTETVKKFIEMDFIGSKNFKLLNGDVDPLDRLDPSLIINLRHEMIEKRSRNNSEHNCSADKRLTVAKLKAHNQSVEEHYIGNELTKFRAQLEKNRLQNQVKAKPKLSLKLDNADIIQSLENCTKQIEDFYKTPIRAIEKAEEVFHAKKDDKKIVHFDDSVELISCSKSFDSNATEEIDSVISDLANEVINEIEEEARLEIVEQEMQLQGEKCSNELEPDMLQIIQLQPKLLHEPEVEEFPLSDDDEDNNSSEHSTDEHNAIVTQLFQTKFPPDDVLMRKYLLKWVHCTVIAKIEKRNFTSKNDHIHKINAFLDNIRREKGRIPKDKENVGGQHTGKSIVVTKKYQNKIKIQQDIIELQKIKLERQERLIMELKLNKLSDEAKEARQDIKNELKAVMRSGDVKNRSKVKSLQIMGNLRDEEDEDFARLQGKALIMPKFLAKMQERALERSVKHEQARQRRLAQEAEREAAKIAAEEAKREEDEEAKRLRIEVLKEKRRLEKMTKVLKERERQRWIEINQKCQAFCRKLHVRLGMEAFRRLLVKKRQNQRKAELFRRRVLKKTVFVAWKSYYVKIWDNKALIAELFYKKLLQRQAITAWITYVQGERSKFLVACDWHELKLTEFVFTRWSGYTKMQKLIECTKMKQAECHHEWHLKWKVVDRWQRLPQILKLEKETDERRQRWRMKIWELLPDYTPTRFS